MAGQPACALRLAAAPEGGRLAHAGAGGRGCGGPWRGPSVLLSRRQRTRRDIEPLHAVDVQSLAESGLSHAPQVRGSQDCLRACEGRGGMSRYHEPLLLLRMLPSIAACRTGPCPTQALQSSRAQDHLPGYGLSVVAAPLQQTSHPRHFHPFIPVSSCNPVVTPKGSMVWPFCTLGIPCLVSPNSPLAFLGIS